jgi:hypothetical protein
LCGQIRRKLGVKIGFNIYKRERQKIKNKKKKKRRERKRRKKKVQLVKKEI